MGVIYKAVNKINGKSYIGQTNNLKRRIKEHIKREDGTAFHAAIMKYGEENFDWEIIEECPEEELNDREIYWITYFDTYSNGYNSTRGGQWRDGLVKWQKENPDKVRQNGINNLKKIGEWWNTSNPEYMAHIRRIQKTGIQCVMRKVRCIELDKIFNSISEAEQWSISSDNPNGRVCHHQHISKVCNGQRHTTGGYHWEYVD